MAPDHAATPKRFPAAPPSGAPAGDTISCRATNPLSLDDDVGRVFLDERQAKATTATRLFRNPELFAALRKRVMPAFFEGAGKRRNTECHIWSAGCSSGEEAYSLAMVAMDDFHRRGLPPRVVCCGTDINPRCLAEAMAGLYGRPGPGAFGPEGWALVSRYMEPEGGGGLRVRPELRSACRFGLFDLRQKPKNHTFDFIVCNHVLQYYDPPGQRHILANFKAVLRPGGRMYLEGITRDTLRGTGFQPDGEAANLFCV